MAAATASCPKAENGGVPDRPETGNDMTSHLDPDHGRGPQPNRNRKRKQQKRPQSVHETESKSIGAATSGKTKKTPTRRKSKVQLGVISADKKQGSHVASQSRGSNAEETVGSRLSCGEFSDEKPRNTAELSEMMCRAGENAVGSNDDRKSVGSEIIVGTMPCGERASIGEGPRQVAGGKSAGLHASDRDIITPTHHVETVPNGQHLGLTAAMSGGMNGHGNPDGMVSSLRLGASDRKSSPTDTAGGPETVRCSKSKKSDITMELNLSSSVSTKSKDCRSKGRISSHGQETSFKRSNSLQDLPSPKTPSISDRGPPNSQNNSRSQLVETASAVVGMATSGLPPAIADCGRHDTLPPGESSGKSQSGSVLQHWSHSLSSGSKSKQRHHARGSDRKCKREHSSLSAAGSDQVGSLRLTKLECTSPGSQQLVKGLYSFFFLSGIKKQKANNLCCEKSNQVSLGKNNLGTCTGNDYKVLDISLNVVAYL